MIRFENTVDADAEALATVQKRAFDSQIPEDMQEIGGPPGYDSAEWQLEMMHRGPYMKILVDEQIIGGIILTLTEPDHCHVDRIFLDPAYHSQGIGTQAFAWLEHTYPSVQLWTLRTAAFQLRNQRFYEKLGYRKTGEKEVIPRLILIEYEKRIKRYEDS